MTGRHVSQRQRDLSQCQVVTGSVGGRTGNGDRSHQRTPTSHIDHGLATDQQPAGEMMAIQETLRAQYGATADTTQNGAAGHSRRTRSLMTGHPTASSSRWTAGRGPSRVSISRRARSGRDDMERGPEPGNFPMQRAPRAPEGAARISVGHGLFHCGRQAHHVLLLPARHPIATATRDRI